MTENLSRAGKTILIVFIVIAMIFIAGNLAKPKIVYIQDPNYESLKPVKVTAYCPCEKCCGKWADGQTASGHWIQLGDRFVAAPKHVPFGTMFVVPGYNDSKPVKVKDRGGAITVDRLDVYFDTHQEALNWGVKYLVVRAIEGE